MRFNAKKYISLILVLAILVLSMVFTGVTGTVGANESLSAGEMQGNQSSITSQELPAPVRTINVSTQEKLGAALLDAQPGDYICLLSDTTYTDLTVSVSGTAESPIVITGQGSTMPVISGSVTFDGNHIWLYKCDLYGEDVRLKVQGDNCKFLSSKMHGMRTPGTGFRETAKFITVSGDSIEIAYCDFFDYTGTVMQLLCHSEVKASDPYIHHNYFYDHKPSPDVNMEETIFVGVTQNPDGIPTRHRMQAIIEYNLFENQQVDDKDTSWVVECKSSSNTIRYNTFINCHSVGVRFGDGNEVYGNVFRNSWGINVQDTNNAFYGNLLIDGTRANGAFQIFSGTQVHDTKEEAPGTGWYDKSNDYNRAENSIVANNIIQGTNPAIRIGYKGHATSELPAFNSMVWNNEGAAYLTQNSYDWTNEVVDVLRETDTQYIDPGDKYAGIVPVEVTADQVGLTASIYKEYKPIPAVMPTPDTIHVSIPVPTPASTQAPISAPAQDGVIKALPVPVRTIDVSTQANLESALTSAQPGDQIRLSPAATYAGFTVSKSGTAEKPIIITWQGNDMPVINSSITLSGNHIWLHKIDLLGADTRLNIQGDGCKFLHSKMHGMRTPGTGFRMCAKFVVVSGADDEIAGCDFYDYTGALMYLVNDDDDPTMLAYNPHIHHNYFHDHKVDKDVNMEETIFVGITQNPDGIPTRHYMNAIIEYNLFDRLCLDDASWTVECKSSGNTIRYNTFNYCRAVGSRFGADNRIYGNTFRNSYGVNLQDASNAAYGNKFINSSRGTVFQVFSGTQTNIGHEKGWYDQFQDYNRAENSIIANNIIEGNNKNIKIGYKGHATSEMPALNTIVWNNQGATYTTQDSYSWTTTKDAGTRETGSQNINPGSQYEGIVPVEVTTSQVGLNAH